MADCIPHWGTLPMAAPFSGPPNWYDSSAGHTIWPGPDDPRWSGAAGHGYSYGTGEEAQFRVLYGEGPSAAVPYYLYMTWVVNNDPEFDTGVDGLYVGFQRPGGGRPLVAELTFNNAGVGSSGAAASVNWYQGGATTPDLTHFELDGLSGITPPNIQPWYWTKPSTAALPSNGWGISVRIPCLPGVAGNPDMSTDGINLGGLGSGATFKFWYGIWIGLAAQQFAPFYWPRTSQFGADASGAPAAPLTSAWSDIHIGTGGGCGNGISLAYGDIGNNINDPVTHLPAPDEVLASLTPTAADENHFFAKPYNNSMSPVPANSIEARFFTANWGSQADYTFITSPAGSNDNPWQEIPFTKGAGDHYVNTSSIGAMSSGQIGFDWTLSHNEAVEYVGDPSTTPPTAPTKWTHNCMLVTLSNYTTLPNPQPTTPPPAPATGLDFLNDSMYHNMSYVKASEFYDDVLISTLGAPKVKAFASGQATPLLVFAEQRNMPLVTAKATVMPSIRSAVGISNLTPIMLGGGDGIGIRPGPTRVLPSLVATVRYHVFRSTGLRLRRHGKWYTCCMPQTSFGYFVEHDGPVLGWKHDFVHSDPRLGKEFPIKRANSALYTINVPHGDALQFTTSIVALQKKPPIITRLTFPAGVAPKAVATPVKVVAKPIVAVSNLLNKVRIGG